MTIRQIEAAELGEILGSLLVSVVQAGEQSSRATADFISDVGFDDTGGGAEQMRMVRMRYKKRDENDNIAEFEVEVPLLAMVNVPSLVVRQAKISLSYDVITTQKPPGTGGSIVGGGKINPAIITGYVRKKPVATGSSSSGNQSQATAIDVDLTLEQQEMPVGVEKLLDLAELGITEERTDGT